MKLPIWTSFLFLSVARIGSSPLPQVPEPEKLAFPIPPGGWVAPPPGWTAPPPVAPVLSSGVVVAAGETAIGADVASVAAASDNVTLLAVAYEYETVDLALSTHLAPTNDMGAGVGGLNASIPGATVESEVAGVDFYGDADDTNDVVTDMYQAYMTSNPTSSASSSFDSLAASSFVSITNGLGLAPVAPLPSGWKKEE